MAKYRITEEQHNLLEELHEIRNMMTKLKSAIKNIGKSPFTQISQKLEKL